MWDIADDEVVSEFSLGRNGMVYGAKWNADETRILIWTEDGTLVVRNDDSLLSLCCENSEVETPRYIWNAEWDIDGNQVLAWSFGDAAAVWDADNGNLLYLFPHDDEVLGARWSSDRRRVAFRILTKAYREMRQRAHKAEEMESLLGY